jgi:dTDP-4-dehydrorhamnose reductase
MIWLIGNKGMLGTELSHVLTERKIFFIGTDREVDITELDALKSFTCSENIDWIINCAAYTAVDKAEDDSKTAWQLNTTGAANIAKCAAFIGAKLIHISTDYVFNGKGTVPYKEDDETDPIGVYGLTKRDGELVVMQNNAASYIIRTAWLYGRYGKNFVETMLHLMNERDEVKVVNDQHGSPTWARDLTGTIISVINQNTPLPSGERPGAGRTIPVPYGIYHYTNEGEITWFDFASEIYRKGQELGLITKGCTVTPCTSAEFPAKVTRPAYSVLDKSKIKTTLGITIPDWKESLRKYLSEKAP